jgi:hypothetical protein
MEKFSLQHTVLYSKGWYKSYNIKGKRKTIWDDLEILLEADGYIGTFNGDSDKQKQNRITYLLVEQLDRIPKTEHVGTLTDFYESIKEYNCWKYGYYTKTNSNKNNTSELPDYDYNEAVVRYCLSFFCNLKTEQWKPIAPDKSVLPLNNGIKQLKIKKIFNND